MNDKGIFTQTNVVSVLIQHFNFLEQPDTFQTQAELQEEKKKLENAILVELNSDELASPDSSREDLRAEWQSEEVEKLRLQVAELQAAAEAANGTATDRNEVGEDEWNEVRSNCSC